MSFNVRNSGANDGEFAWQHRREAALAMLNEQMPALLGVQEALPDQLADLDRGLGGEYQRYSRGREADGSGEHSAIYVRKTVAEVEGNGHFWLSETPDVPGSKHWDHHCVRLANFVELSHNDWGRFLFINTHLDHESALARRKGAELISGFIGRCRLPAILTGDMNAGPSSEPIAVFAQGGLLISGAAYETGLHTFHGFGRYQGDVIDYILHTPHWQASGYEIVTAKPQGMYPSDHYPVIADLQRKAE